MKRSDLCSARLAAVLATCATVLPWVASPTSAVAQSAAAEIAFDIPSGPLEAALRAAAARAGGALDLRGLSIEGRTAAALRGRMTLQQAINTLLADSGLRGTVSPDGTVVLAQGVQEMQRVTITANRASHLAARNRTGTRSDVDPMALPQSVTTVDKGLLNQQQVRDVRDAMSNIAGAGAASTIGSTPTITLRGFPASLMRNGNVVASGRNFNPPQIALDRIEVVKGPEAIVAGTTNYGGVVNVITKVPQLEPVRELLVSGGGRGYYEVGADLGSPLTQDKSLLARLLVSKTGQSRSTMGYRGDQRDYVSPSITWGSRELGTDVAFNYEWQKTRTAPSDTILFDPANPFDTDAKLVRFGPRDSGVAGTQRVASLNVDQRIVAGWSLGAKLSRDKRNDDGLGLASILASDLGFDYPQALSIANRVSTRATTDTAKLELTGNFETGPVDNQLLLAYDLMRSRLRGDFRKEGLWSTHLRDGSSLDVTDDPSLSAFFGLPDAGDNFEERPHETGLLLLNHMTWEQWSGVLGWRRVTYRTDDPVTGAPMELIRGLPTLGVVYRWTPSLSLFASLSKGFSPNLGLYDVNLNPLPPNESRQGEVGFKVLLLDKRVALSGSIYRIKEKNLAVEDPFNPPDPDVAYVTINGADVRGAELDLSGRVTRGLTLRANYAYADKRAESPAGIRLPFVRHSANVWATWHPSGDEEKGWWLGTGIGSQSRVEGATVGIVPPKAQARIDLATGYEAATWSIALGVKNVRDTRLYTLDSNGAGLGTLAQPRSFSASLRGSF